jgi:hypothetical protein
VEHELVAIQRLAQLVLHHQRVCRAVWGRGVGRAEPANADADGQGKREERPEDDRGHEGRP